MDAINLVLVRFWIGLMEVKVAHVVDRHDVDMDVWNFETGDHQADAGGGKHMALGLANSMSDRHEMGDGVGFEIGPMIDLSAGNDEHMARGEWTDVHERNADVVGVNETARDLAVDDAGEDCGHQGIVGCKA